MTTEMSHVQGVCTKLLMVSGRGFCQRTALYARCISFVTASCSQTSTGFYWIHKKLLYARVQMTTAPVQCRLKSDATISAAEHFVELGMPQTPGDVQRLTENVTARSMNLDVGDLVSFQLLC